MTAFDLCAAHGFYTKSPYGCPRCDESHLTLTTDGKYEAFGLYETAYTTSQEIQSFTDAAKRITRFTVYGEPIPKARARFGVGKTYDPEKNRNYKNLIQDTLDSVGTFYEKDIQLGVAMLFYRKNNVKADTDNLTKAIFDACNKKLWDDDKQIRASYSEVHYADKNPRAEIIVCPLAHFRDELKALLDKLDQ